MLILRYTQKEKVDSNGLRGREGKEDDHDTMWLKEEENKHYVHKYLGMNIV